MKGNLLIGLVIVAVVGGALFGDQVLALFAGMTALEALRTIVTFILHVAVATIASWAAFTLPELLKPWRRALRKKRRLARRQPTQVAAPRAPRMNYAALLRLLLTQGNLPKARGPLPYPSPFSKAENGEGKEDRTHLNF